MPHIFDRSQAHAELPPGIVACLDAYHEWADGDKYDPPPQISHNNMRYMRAKKNWRKFFGANHYREAAWSHLVGQHWLDKNMSKIFNHITNHNADEDNDAVEKIGVPRPRRTSGRLRKKTLKGADMVKSTSKAVDEAEKVEDEVQPEVGTEDVQAVVDEDRKLQEGVNSVLSDRP